MIGLMSWKNSWCSDLSACPLDSRLERALKGIEDSAGQIRIAQLARDSRISPRHLHRLVRKWVDSGPKRLARIVRFQEVLKRMETGLINGRSVEKAGRRRRRFYKLTAAGQKILAGQRKTWKDFFAALDRVAGINPA